MILPKPELFAIPTCDSPFGAGLAACNSNNKCNDQACDNGHTEGSSVWEVFKEAAEKAATMFSLMGFF